MANLYTPEQLKIKAPQGGFQQGGWYNGRQYYNGTFSDPNVIHPQSSQQGAGQAVSEEVKAQSAAQQGVSTQQFNNYLQQQQQKSANITPTGTATPMTPTGGQPVAPTAGAGGTGMTGTGFNQPTIDLPKVYESLYASSGIKEKLDDLSKKEREYIDAQAEINDNPWIAEATRMGRQAKLSDIYEKRTANLKNEVATQKADLETKLNIQMKQFDINSQQAQMALQQFNTLLGLGAFDNASGDDIANITRATGIPSSMILSAVQSKKNKEVETSTVSFDDGTDQGFAVINSRTGEIISKQVVARSKPKASAQASESDKKSYYMNSLRQDAQSGLTLSQIFQLYTGYLDPDTIYQLYNSNSKYGPDKGDIKNLEKYGVKQPY